MMNGFSVVLCILFWVHGPINCTQSTKDSSVIVETPSGRIIGHQEIYNHTHPIIRFIGIPYAQPPIDDLRFEKPRPIGKWDGVQGIPEDHGPGCMQDGDKHVGTYTMKYSEDCLYLNIYVPGRKINRHQKLSVLVWILGTDFSTGSASEYFPHSFVVHGEVIVITFNYRLGLFGFLNLLDPEVKGNVGLWDQMMTLQWIHDNIAAVGGDPGSVTIFGHGSGAVSAHLLSVIPRNKGLFQRVIAMSGVISRNTIVKRQNTEYVNKLLSERVKCPEITPTSEFLKCLRSLPASYLSNAVKMADFIPVENITFDLFIGPSIDGDLIKENPHQFLHDPDSSESQFFRSLDFIAGTVSVEGSLLYRKIMTAQMTRLVSDYETNFNFTIDTGIPFRVFKESIAPGVIHSLYGNNPNLTRKVCDFYSSHRGSMDQSNQIVKMYGEAAITTPTISALVAHSRNNTKSNTYQYLVTLVSPLPEGPPPPLWFGGCGHEDDLYLLFRLMATPINLQMMDFHHELSRKMIQYWANLVKTGNPNDEKTEVTWPTYDEDTRHYLILDYPIVTHNDLSPEEVALFQPELPNFIKKVTPAAHDEL